MWDAHDVSAMSRRNFLTATMTVVGAGLATACAFHGQRSPDGKPVLVVGAGMAGLAGAGDRGSRPCRRPRLYQPRLGRTAGHGWVVDSRHHGQSAGGACAAGADTDTFHRLRVGEDDGRSGAAADALRRRHWRRLVEQPRDKVDGGTLAAAVDGQATRQECSEAERLQLDFYLTTEIAQEYAADADQLSATTFDERDYTTGAQVILPGGYDALPRLLADGLEIVMNTRSAALSDALSAPMASRRVSGSAGSKSPVVTLS